MHELAIAETIYKTVREAMNREGYLSIQKIGLRIGVLTDIVPDALAFGFEAIVRGTPLEGASLAIQTVSIRAVCRDCDHEFSVEDFVFVCPRCRSRDVVMTEGDELDIAYLEIESADPADLSPDRAQE